MRPKAAGLQAVVSEIEMLGDAAKSPVGSIAQYLPAPGSGSRDYAGLAMRQGLTAA